MKTGKLTENVWKRSVLKYIKTKREEVITGAEGRENCAVFSLGACGLTAVSSYTGHWPGRGTAKFALNGSMNALAALGADPVAADISVLLPEGTGEAGVKALTIEMEEECALLGIQIAGCHMEISGAVRCPVMTVAGIGKQQKKEEVFTEKIMPGLDIVASKWIGLTGTLFLAENKENELLSRYPARFLQEAKSFGGFLSVIPEAATAVKSGVCAMHSVGEGGIFGALWEMAARAGVGLEVDLKKIPVKQETIEICEFFGLNPYEISSGGCLLMAVDRGEDLVGKLEKKYIPAAVIGKTTDDNDRVIINGEERRFLEPRKPDEIYKVIVC